MFTAKTDDIAFMTDLTIYDISDVILLLNVSQNINFQNKILLATKESFLNCGNRRRKTYFDGHYTLRR